MTFYEVHARSIVNRVPSASRLPFTWTVNPYRGCTHACRYCFARQTHTYLDLDAGADFDSPSTLARWGPPARYRAPAQGCKLAPSVLPSPAGGRQPTIAQHPFSFANHSHLGCCAAPIPNTRAR